MPVLTVGDATNSAFTGNITGSLSVAKQGAGTLELGSANDFTGTTTVNGGQLLVSGSLSGTTAVAVNAGTLGGSGSINPAANITVAAGGAIAPGASIGTLSTGPVAFASGSAFTLELGATTADKLLVAGAASLSGTIALNLTLVADPVDFTTFTVLDGTAALTGYAGGARFSFGANSLDEGEIFDVFTGPFSQTFQISYNADGGNDVTLSAIPEPGSAALLLLGLAGFCGRRRRRA
jgi:autotransporter-associated beta strand protein